MASQTYAPIGQEEDKENRYRGSLAQLVESRNDLLFQRFISPEVEEGLAPPLVVANQRSETRRWRHESSSHDESHRFRGPHHESKGRTHHSRLKSPSLSSSSSTDSPSASSSSSS